VTVEGSKTRLTRSCGQARLKCERDVGVRRNAKDSTNTILWIHPTKSIVSSLKD